MPHRRGKLRDIIDQSSSATIIEDGSGHRIDFRLIPL